MKLNNMEDLNSKIDSLISELNDIGLIIGIYPRAFVGKYEKRSEFQEGWNAAVMDITDKVEKILEKHRTTEISEGLKFLVAADVGWLDDGKFYLNMNDTWAWACADNELVPEDKISEVAGLFRKYGRMGLLYWVSKQNNNMKSEFHDINRFIEIVDHEEVLHDEETDPSKRAYKKVKYSVGRRW